MKVFKKYLLNKKIIITGHTGFKGSWLTLWCILSGARVHGISNKTTSNPSHFERLKLKKILKVIKLILEITKN